MKKGLLPVLLAEFLGTFTLCLVVALSVVSEYPVATPVLAGLVLALFVYTIGSLSGCHINPAVTIGLWSIKKIQGHLALKYIAAQLLAAMLVLFIVDFAGMGGEPVPFTPNIGYLFEFLGMAIFTFGIAAMVSGTGKEIISGAVVGGSLLLGISISVLGGGLGILNPAVAVSLSVFNIGYLLAEILGGILGFQIYIYLTTKKSAI